MSLLSGRQVPLYWHLAFLYISFFSYMLIHCSSLFSFKGLYDFTMYHMLCKLYKRLEAFGSFSILFINTHLPTSCCSCSFPQCVFCVLFVGDYVCDCGSGKWSAPVDLDLSWTSGVYLTVSTYSLKRWTDCKWMEHHSDTSRSEAQ